MNSASTRLFAAFAALAVAALAQSPVQFTDVTAASGIDYAHKDRIDTMAGGACAVDYDGDGDEDLFFTSRGGGAKNRLYQNQGNGTFVDVTTAAGVDASVDAMGAYAADLDDDGWQDLLVLVQPRLMIYRNKADGTFEDVSSRSTLQAAWSTSATFGDYDHDGDLDVYVGTYVLDGFFPYFTGSSNMLLRNDGGFRFVDVAKAAGVDGDELVWDPQWSFWKNSGPCTLSVLFFDHDHDGWQDILVGNDFGPFVIPNQLFRNDRNGRFTEVGTSANFRIAEFNMGLVTADVNGDQIPDIYTSNLGDNHLLLNDAYGRFFDVAAQRGALEGTSAGVLLTSWAATFLDVDLDALPDLYVSNGYIKTVPAMANDPNSPSRLLRNLGSTFEIVPEPAFPWDRDVGRGALRVDLDRDGDEDLVQINNRSKAKIFRNDCKAGHGSVILDLVGTLSNRQGVGALVEIVSRQFRQTLEHTRGGSYCSGDAASIIRGLGSDQEVRELRVRWPSGVDSSRFGLAGSSRHEIVEPRVTLEFLGTPAPIGTELIEIRATVHNHASTAEAVTFTAEVLLGGTRYAIPAWHHPASIGAGATAVVPLYLPIPYTVLPLARRMGVWLNVAIADRDSGADEIEQPLR